MRKQSAVKKWRRAFFSATVPGLQHPRARAKQDWLARLAAAPPGDSFVTCPYTCLRLPALVPHQRPPHSLPTRTRTRRSACLKPPSFCFHLVRRTAFAWHVLCALSFAYCPLHTPNLSVSYLTRFATTVIFPSCNHRDPDYR
jgi:hypothetical protein